MSDNSPQFDTAYKWLQDNIDTRMWDMNSALSLANLLRAEHAPASQSAQGAPEPPRDDTSPGDVIAAYPDGTIVLDDGITTHNAKRATEFLCEGCRNGWKRVKRANRVDTPKYGEEVWVHRKPFQAGYVYVRCLAAPQPEPPRWIPPKAEQLIRRLHEIAATSDEETGAALSETADMLAACFDEKIKVCPICGNKEVHPGTGMLTCECPALKRFSDETQRMVAPQPDSGETLLPSREKIQGGFDVLLQIRHWIRMSRIPWPITPGVDIPSSHAMEGFIASLYYQYERALAAPQPVAERGEK